MTQRNKNFNYYNATVEEIVEKFKESTHQNIYAVRKSHADNLEMTEKLNKAFYLYKVSKIKLPS